MSRDRDSGFSKEQKDRYKAIRAKLRDAIDEKLPVRIEYTDVCGENTVRHIAPESFVGKGIGSATVLAWCLLRRDYRVFRISRIQKLERWQGDATDAVDTRTFIDVDLAKPAVVLPYTMSLELRGSFHMRAVMDRIVAALEEGGCTSRVIGRRVNLNCTPSPVNLLIMSGDVSEAQWFAALARVKFLHQR